MPEPCSQQLKSTCKLSHDLSTIEGKATIGDLMSCEDFSDLQRLVRVTAYVLRVVECFKTKKKCYSDPLSSLTPQEISAAEILCIFYTQEKLAHQKDFNTLKSQLGLFCYSRSLWRCGSRLQNAEIPYSAKHPV